MSLSSDEDFTEPKMRTRRQSYRRRVSTRTVERKRRAQQDQAKPEENGIKKRKAEIAKWQAMLASASQQEKGDIDFILDLKERGGASLLSVGFERVKEEWSMIDEEGASQNKNGDRKGREELERLDILKLLRDRREYAKSALSVLEQVAEEVKGHGSARYRIRAILVVLGIKRRIGQKLPGVADLASHLFHGQKGPPTTAWQERVATDMLIHTIRVRAVDGNGGRPLNKFERTMLSLEQF